MYHGVAEDDFHGKFTLFDDFKLHLDLLERHFQLVSVQQIEDWLLHGATIPPNAVALTFDDGYRNLLDTAIPELLRRGHPATIFLCTLGFQDASRITWTDEVDCRMRSSPRLPDTLELPDAKIRLESLSPDTSARCVKEHLKTLSLESNNEAMVLIRETFPVDEREFLRCRLLAPSDLAGINDSGISIGGHTEYHEILSRLSAGNQREDIRLNYESIRRVLAGNGPTHLAYPNGKLPDIGTAARKAVEDAGYRLAFTTQEGFIRPDTDPLMIPRISAGFLGMYAPEAWISALPLRVWLHQARHR